MNRQRIGFPLIVGLKTTDIESASESLVTAIRNVFAKLRERSPFGVLIIHSGSAGCSQQIAEAAKEAGVNYRATEGVSGTQTAASAKGGLTRAEMELVETADVLILISSTTAVRYNEKNDDLLAYARGIGRPVIRIDGETGTLEGGVPQQIEIDQGWLPELFEMAGLSSDADLQTIKSKMSALANRSAPVTRGWWYWIIALEALAVCAPLGWLIHYLPGLSPELVAVVTLLAALMLTAAIWWLRWRGMQKTWARSRLVAEAARSLLATATCPGFPSWPSLAAVPALRPLRRIALREQRVTAFPEWRDVYTQKRIEDQETHFTNKQGQAQTRRKQLSRWTTILLDLVLALAFFGAVIAFLGQSWFTGLSGDVLQVAFGVGGVTFAVGLLLIQILGYTQDLNRRTARYAQQRQLLHQAKLRLENVQLPEAASEVIEDTENKLLAEVLEWYFHAETAETFVRIRDTQGPTRAIKALRATEYSPAARIGRKVAGESGLAGLFILRVIFGRLPWILASMAAAIGWIAYHATPPGSSTRQFESSVHLLDANGTEKKDNSGQIADSFSPTKDQAERGCVVLVHGLYGAASPDDADKSWMKDCAAAIVDRLNTPGQIGEPAICLVDWKNAARPSKFFNFHLGTEKNLLADVFAIRPQAYAVGDYVATKLAKLINENKIRKDQPFHLIGHSAGGFIVTRIARRLSQEGFVSNKKMLRVTILDTPMPDDEILRDLPELWPTDFFLTSNVVWPTPFTDVIKAKNEIEKHLRDPGLSIIPGVYKDILQELATDPCATAHVRGQTKQDEPKGFWQRIWNWMSSIGIEFWKAHRSAYSWFKLTIECPEKHKCEGFNRSPLLHPVDCP